MRRSYNTPRTMLTTESTIIFPLHHDNKQFNSRLYTLALTNGRASNREIDTALADIMTAGNDPSNKKRWSRLSCFGFLLLLVVSILQLCGICVLVHKIREIDSDDPSEADPLVLGAIFLGIGLFVSVIFCVVVCFQKTDSSMIKIRKRCQDVIDEHNKALIKKGLRWHMPEEFPDWVELWKDYKLEAFGDEKTDVNVSENHGEREDIEKGLRKESVDDQLELMKEKQGLKTQKDEDMFVVLN